MNWKFWKRSPSLNLRKNIKRSCPYIVCHEIISATIAAISALMSTVIGVPVGVMVYGLTVGAIVKGLVIAGFVLASMAATQKAKLRSGGSVHSDFKSSGHLINTTSQSEPIPIPYGTCRIGGNVVYKHCTGTDNKYYHRIITFGYGPVNGIKQDGQSDKIWLDDKRIQDFGSLAYWEFFTGTSTQNVCATLQAAHPEFDDAMRDIAYLYVRLEFNSEKFASEPQVTIELEGRKIYDPRDGQTKFTANNALVAYDFLRSDLYSIGLPVEVFDEDLIKDAANWCDTNGYGFNGAIMDRQPLLDNFEVILQNFRAGLPWSEGLYKLLVYEYDTPVMHLTEDDIEADSFRIVGPGIPETPNRCLITFMDAVNNYVSKTKPVEDPEAVLTYDGEERDFELDLKGVTNATQAEKLGTYYVERNRLNFQFPLVAHPRTLALDPMDMIQITHSLPGWTQKIVRILDIEQRQDGKANLLVLAELSSLYDDDVDVAVHNAYETNLPNPLAIPPNVIDIEIKEELYGTKNNILTKLKISFNIPESYHFFDHGEIWISMDGTNYILYNAKAGIYTEILRVDELITYYIKIVPVSTYMIKRPLNQCTAYSHYIFGKTAKPSDVTEFWGDASMGGLRLNWLPVNDVDLDYYQIKWASDLDASWSEAIDIAKSYATSKSFPAAKSGKYFIKAIDTSGNESVNPISLITNIPSILVWNVQEELIEDPLFEGIKINMFIEDGILYLGSAGLFDNEDMFDSDKDFDWGEYGVAGEGYYEAANIVDLGSIQESRCSFNPVFFGINAFEMWDGDDLVDSDELVDGDVNMVGIIPQVALSQNGSDWSDWINFFIGDYIARAYKFRIKAYSNQFSQYLGIAFLEFYIDMPDRTESGQDIVIPAGGTTISFSKPYMIKPKIGITLQSANAGEYYDLQSVNTNNFIIQIKNGSGIGIQKTIDWEAKGY